MASIETYIQSTSNNQPLSRMQSGSGDHRFKHHHRAAASQSAHQVLVEMPELTPHKLADAPPYSDIYRTSHGFQAPRPGAKGKVGAAGQGHHVGAADNGGDDGEDIDAEAEEFIKREHGKFELSKWMSIRRG